MADPFTGEVRAFAFNYAPENWSYCAGNTIVVAQNTALYSVLGNTYGGTPNQTFQLPQLINLTPMGTGGGASLGQTMGYAQWPLTLAQKPVHSHNLVPAYSNNYPSIAGVTAVPTAGATFDIIESGSNMQEVDIFAQNAVQNSTLAPANLASVGNGLPHENRQPLLALNFCICLYGEYPIRPS
jgi:microcystin-dependent protein